MAAWIYLWWYDWYTNMIQHTYTYIFILQVLHKKRVPKISAQDKSAPKISAQDKLAPKIRTQDKIGAHELK